MTDSLLVINAGSSSIKFAIYAMQKEIQTPLLSGKFSNIGQKPELMLKNAKGMTIALKKNDVFDSLYTHQQLIPWLLDWLSDNNQAYNIVGVGHRVVHGGQSFLGPTIITEQVLTKLAEFIPLAPMHQPHNLAAIKSIADWLPKLTHVACFDTSFHRTQSKLAQSFALPRKFTEDGILRYGFHGLSYQYIASCLPEFLGELSQGRIVVAHLGNGASMCAMHERQSVATSMGFTALDGLMMGQRCGALDAGVVLHFLQHYKMTVDEVQHLLYHESGLLGVSGISNNMQVLQKSHDPNAKEAIDLYCYIAARELMSLVADVKGLDAIVFTAGIGENSSLIREGICAQLKWLGLILDADANNTHRSLISHRDSSIKVVIIPTDEELVIAQATRELTSA